MKNPMTINRVTAIVGAGAVLGICPNDKNYPSTANITSKVIEPYKTIISDYSNIAGSTMVESHVVLDIYKHLCRNNIPTPLKFFSQESLTLFNFELIFHIIELLHTNDKVWNFDDSEYTGVGKIEHFRTELFNPFSYFVSPIFKHYQHELDQCIHPYIRRIMDIVNVYDSAFRKDIRTKRCQWYKNFWAQSEFRWDVFNFNYDTTIESCLKKYNDGYIPIAKGINCKKIDIKHLLENKKGYSTINHIHGCIVYGAEHISEDLSRKHLRGLYGFGDWFKYPTYKETPKSYKSDDVGQNRQSYIPVPIITGLDKVEKLSALPFSAYRLNLEQQVIKNRSLLIVGYSFGDLYVNSILERMRLIHGDKQRVVIIDFWGEVITNYNTRVDSQIEQVKKENKTLSKKELIDLVEKEKVGLMKEMIKDYVEFENKLNHEESYFIGKTLNNSVWNLTSECELKKTDGPLIAKNGQMLLFFHGFKDAVDNYQDEIYKFLQS